MERECLQRNLRQKGTLETEKSYTYIYVTKFTYMDSYVQLSFN